MPKHTRSSSSNQNRYSNQNSLPVSLAPSAMPLAYTTRALPLNTNLNTNYYSAVPTSAQASVPMAQAYDPYPAAVATQPPPMPHRPSSGAWSQQDDHNLLTARQQGLNWAQIQSTYFPNKSPNACRKRHERLLERRGADDWDARKLERLAKEYMSMRKEIWQGLAARTGDKWTVVEAKCMHNGLKNLQSASRSAARRERLEQGHSIHGYDDDSGISGIGLTPVDDLDASYSSPETTASSTQSHHSGGSGYGMQHPMTIPYGSAAGYSSSYSSSVSSNAAHGGYAMHGHPHHHSQDSSPYMGNGQRLPSVDMGIEAIINRPGHGRGHNGSVSNI
ncbi:hypothetical protein E0Z10_g1226 [Xylaria hypoxylon]|uniref:Myb-like domain-containing protein n=1 Tax=Xylaria hypoxylon TaxID=37992 RepID=A0A4Z0Z7U2_9PEZI|nr:hypothetical protein E0Z10_g1226 [Xylaria hypoxylon]